MNINDKKNWSERNYRTTVWNRAAKFIFFHRGRHFTFAFNLNTCLKHRKHIHASISKIYLFFHFQYNNIQKHKHTEMKHCFTTQELSNRWPQHRSTVSMAWVRCSSWPLQLELPSFTAVTDKLPQHDRPPISQLSRPVSELVPSIPVWQRERTRQNERATHKFHKLYFWGCSISQTKNIIKNRLRKSNKPQSWLQWNRIGDRKQTARDLSNKILCNRIQREGGG